MATAVLVKASRHAAGVWHGSVTMWVAVVTPARRHLAAGALYPETRSLLFRARQEGEVGGATSGAGGAGAGRRDSTECGRHAHATPYHYAVPA